MKFICVEIEGIPYSPENIFAIDDYWIIPATKDSGALEERQCKIILAFKEKTEDIKTKVKLFIFCYQFLFLHSKVYYFDSLKKKYSQFTEEGDNIKQIAKKYEAGKKHNKSFEKLDSFYTQLPSEINFKEFYEIFVKKYNEKCDFMDIIDLYLYTVGSHPKFYKNTFQKFAQLQTIIETILGERKKVLCVSCGEVCYEHWQIFLERELANTGVKKNRIDLIIKIFKGINVEARIPYTHLAKQFDPWRKIQEEIETGNHFSGQTKYETNFDDILNNVLKIKKWAGIDWENVYCLYQIIIKELICIKYSMCNEY
jgi:hypothetical protein